MLELIKPKLEELNFKQELLSDETTMSFNNIYGGTIDFPKERWLIWYQKWIESNNPNYFYRYLYSKELNVYVGEVAYHYEEETDRYLCDVIIHAKYRNKGFGKEGLNLLCKCAKENGIHVLYDDILLDNPSVYLFLKNGFIEEKRTDEIVIVKKNLTFEKGKNYEKL